MPGTKTDIKPLVIVTGATGNIGGSLCEALERDFRVVGLDRNKKEGERDVFTFDITDEAQF